LGRYGIQGHDIGGREASAVEFHEAPKANAAASAFNHLRVSEARDLGDVDRSFDHLKPTAAPPDVLRVDESTCGNTQSRITGVIS
jgi:hypothetical protein